MNKSNESTIVYKQRLGIYEVPLHRTLKFSTNLNGVFRIYLVSKSNIMKDFVFEERVKKLEELNKDERIKMVWMWCKQNVITLNQFKQLISYCC